MTPFIERLITLLFNITLNIVIGILVYWLVVWAAGIFAIPPVFVQLIGFLIFIYFGYRVLMLVIAFLKSNPVQ